MSTVVKMQGEVAGGSVSWLATSPDYLALQYTGAGTPANVVIDAVYSTASAPAPFTCTLSAGAFMNQGEPNSLTVTVSAAANVLVLAGATVLFSGLVSALSFITWVPPITAIGLQTLTAHAVAVSGGAAADAPAILTTVRINPILTQAFGAQLFFDASISPGSVDGSPVAALTNLSGSNAVFDSANNWGFGAVTLPTYRSTIWHDESPGLDFDSGMGMRFTGSDLTGCINGLGKIWYAALVYQPVCLSGTLLYPGGFTAKTGGGFSSGMLHWIANWGTPGTPPVAVLQGQAATNVSDTQRLNWQPMIFEIWRPDSGHVQTACNGVDSTPIPYGNGTTFANIDAWTLGAWNNVSNNGLGNSQMRVAGHAVYSQLPSRTAVRAALKARFKGFDWQASLGAT